MMTDPIADMLTRIRNANQLHYTDVKIPSSKMKIEIARILLEEGFIVSYNVEGGVKKTLSVVLKYGANKERVITGLKRISKPGLRVMADHAHLPRVRNGLGIAIVSTDKGVMTDRDARKAGVGGEILAYIY